MSYSLYTPCHNFPCGPETPKGQGDCIHKDKCTDRHVIQGAIQTIHMMPFGVGHLGAGSITLSCFNKKTREDEAMEILDVQQGPL